MFERITKVDCDCKNITLVHNIETEEEYTPDLCTFCGKKYIVLDTEFKEIGKS
jgi:hypothetical protein